MSFAKILLEIADDFMESVTSFACALAKHRKSDTLEVKDLALHLERNWNIKIPGYYTTLENVKPPKKASIPEAHKQRLALIKKTGTSKTPKKRKQSDI
jgi:transcription initiation factor TFIID subunit 12